MAVDTIAVGRHVVVILAQGSHAVVTDAAIVSNALVFEPGIGKGGRCMTQRTIVADWNVGWVDLGRGAGGIDSVVAGCTVVHDSAVIEDGRLKTAAGGVTETTILGCHNVTRVHAFCRTRAVGYVTGIATYREYGGIVVIDKRVGEINCVMAQGTIGRGHRVRRSRRFGPGTKGNKTGAAIVAGGAITGDAFVCQHRCRCETGHRMADVTILAGR